jgi:hypothetical protein
MKEEITDKKQIIEKIILNEAIDNFVLNNRNINIFNDKTILDRWINYSSQFVQIWLSYMTDKQIETLLTEKMKKKQDKYNF